MSRTRALTLSTPTSRLVVPGLLPALVPALVLGLVLGLLAALQVAVAPTGRAAAAPIEDYASYQPQTRCRPHAKPGAAYLQRRLVARFGGSAGPIGRPCSSGGTSEHKEGRALDWTLDATRKADRRRAKAFLRWVRADDRAGHADARARRMGIMYVIWDDHMYPAWSHFEREKYLSSSCHSRKRCSTTLRHRDHLHVSLDRRGGKGRTSWFVQRMPRP